MTNDTAKSRWNTLSSARNNIVTNWEKFSAFTVPRLCTPDGVDEENRELKHDWQSVGAQAVNHVANKLMLTLFAPSRPFMRLEISDEVKVAIAENGASIEDVEDALATVEREAVKQLEATGDVRPKLHLAILNLIVLGNTLLYLPKTKDESMRCFYSKSWVVRRTGTGKVKELIIRECYKFDELDDDIQESLVGKHYRPDTKIELYKWITRNPKGGYELVQYVDDIRLPDKYDGSWKDYDDLPYKVIPWQLKDGDSYGTGLVEDYSGDFAALSALSEAQVKSACISAEIRYLVNPGGITKVEDFMKSNNGDAIPGAQDDITVLETKKGNDLQIVLATAETYIQRIGRGFLLNSAVTRDAERVTAEEIRMQANELETSLGGAYSRIALEMQLPMARWLLSKIEFKATEEDIQLTIITGLDALSRSGDLDNLRGALADISSIAAAPPMLMQFLNMQQVITTIFTGHGLSAGKYVKPQEQVQQEQQQAAQEEQQAVVNAEAAKAGAQVAASNMEQQ